MWKLWLLGVTLIIVMSSKAVAEEVMRVSEEGKKLIEKFEVRKQEIYICPGGKVTGGIGHALSPKERRLRKVGSHVEGIQIDKWFEEDLEKAIKTVTNWVVVELNQNQFDSLVSFVFNVGADNFKRSTLLKLLNKGAFNKASDEFKLWVHAKGVRLPGLVARRQAEADLFRQEVNA